MIEVNYQQRMLMEYNDLLCKIFKLGEFLDKNEKTSKNIELMKNQLEHMRCYSEILEQRILIEMENN